MEGEEVIFVFQSQPPLAEVKKTIGGAVLEEEVDTQQCDRAFPDDNRLPVFVKGMMTGTGFPWHHLH